MWVSIERNKKENHWLLYYHLIFLFFLRASFFLVEHLYIIPNSPLFPPKKYNNDFEIWRSHWHLRLLLLLIIIYFIFNSPRADDQRPAVVVVFRIDVSIHVLVRKVALSAATLPCWFVLVVVVVAASADVVVFIFIIFSRTLSYWFLFSVFPVHWQLGAVTCDFFFSLSEGRALIIRRLFFTYSIIHFLLLLLLLYHIHEYSNFSTCTLLLAGWLFNREKLSPIS